MKKDKHQKVCDICGFNFYPENENDRCCNSCKKAINKEAERLKEGRNLKSG